MRSIGLAALALAALVVGRPGSLDPTFGSGGKVLTRIGEGSSASAVALQRGGKIVVAGSTRTGSNSDFALARYTPRGRLDRRFGQGGKLKTDFGSLDYVGAMKIQADRKIVVVGDSLAGPMYRVALARYTPNGSLDPTFGVGGKVEGPAGFAIDVALQRDGKLIVGGASDRSFALFRFRDDGSLDPTFGANGEVTTPFEPNYAAVEGLAVQPDGKIVAVGYAAEHDFSGWAIARYNADGSLDETFGSGGKVTALGQSLGGDGAWAVALQGGKRILVAGTSETQFAVAGFRPNGEVDSSFGQNGGVTRYGASALGGSADAIAIQRDGKIVLAGNANDSYYDRFALARVDGQGIPDPGFGGGDLIWTGFGSEDDRAYSLVIEGDGKLVVAGVAGSNGSHGRIALARYLTSSECLVPDVRGRRLAAARRALIRADCSLGRVAHAFSSSVTQGRVISQRPRPGAERPEHARVRLVVSRGRR